MYIIEVIAVAIQRTFLSLEVMMHATWMYKKKLLVGLCSHPGACLVPHIASSHTSVSSHCDVLLALDHAQLFCLTQLLSCTHFGSPRESLGRR